jgi:hypothetical protein
VSDELPEDVAPLQQRRDYRKPTRFRATSRALDDSERALIKRIKDKAEELALLYEEVTNSRYRSLAMTDLENSVMWIVKEITG